MNTRPCEPLHGAGVSCAWAGNGPHRLYRVDLVPHSQGRTWTEPSGPEDPARLGLAPSPMDLPKSSVARDGAGPEPTTVVELSLASHLSP